MRFKRLLQLGWVAASCQMACNWNDFNSVLDKAPVVSFDNGSSTTGSVIGLALPPPAPGGKVSARMLVSRRDSTYLALAEFDKDGKASIGEASGADLANLGSTPVTSMAALDPSKPDSPILLGTPSYGHDTVPSSQAAPGRVSLLSMTTLADGTATLSVQPAFAGTDHFGIAVASGRVTDLSGAPQFVAVSDVAVQVLGADARTPGASTGCQNVSFADSSGGLVAPRALAVADLLPGGLDEIVLGGLGRVIFIQYDPTTQGLVCSPLVLTPPAASAGFGDSLAVADFDGDGHMDLAVGAPLDHVYVYFGPLVGSDATAIPSVSIRSSGGSAFGRRIAVYTVPPAPGTVPPVLPHSQLLVADPQAAVGSRAGAGKVVLLNVARAAQEQDAASLTITTVFDSNENAPAGVFGGESLGSVWFDTRSCNPAGGIALPLWVASGTKMLTFFNYPTNTTVLPPAPVADPRCFGK